MYRSIEQLGSTSQRALDIEHAFSIIKTDKLIYSVCRLVVNKDDCAASIILSALKDYFIRDHSFIVAESLAVAVISELKDPCYCKKCNGDGTIKVLDNRKRNKLIINVCDKCTGIGWRWRVPRELEDVTGLGKSRWYRNDLMDYVKPVVNSLLALSSQESQKINRALNNE